MHKEFALRWRHNGRDSVSNHQPHDCLLNRLFKRRTKETWKFRVAGLCAGKSPVSGEFPAEMASNAENISISILWTLVSYRHNHLSKPVFAVAIGDTLKKYWILLLV